MPYFVHLDDAVPQVERLVEFHTHPRAPKATLRIVMATRRLLFRLRVRATKHKHQLLIAPVRQHGMQQQGGTTSHLTRPKYYHTSTPVRLSHKMVGCPKGHTLFLFMSGFRLVKSMYLIRAPVPTVLTHWCDHRLTRRADSADLRCRTPPLPDTWSRSLKTWIPT